MKIAKSKTLCRSLFAVLLVLSLAILTACNTASTDVSEKHKIIQKMESTLEKDSMNYDYCTDYLYYWGIKNIDIQKVSMLERVFDTYYNYDGGMPTKLEHARLVTTDFIENYYDKIDLDDQEAVTDAILTCFADVTNDPYAIYRPPQEADEYTTDMSGKFGGIGVLIEYNDQNQTLMVSSVYVDSPADKAGLLAGDYFYAVDGKTVEEIGYRDVVNYVRGEIGTDVVLTMKRGDQMIDFTVTRAEVVEKTVAYAIESETQIGYIQITDFKGTTYDQFVEAVDFMEENGAKGIIFDLRYNLGGYVSTVCDIVSYLIPTGNTIVSYQYKGRVENVIKSHDDIHPTKNDPEDPTKALVKDHFINIPIVVLCNEYTASAAEIFTAAVRDYRDDGLLNATIVGALTFKKGIMQNTYSYIDGSSVTFTVAYYNPPCGVNYHGIGITPDVEIQNTQTEDLQFKRGYEELEKLINANNS